MTDVWLAGAGHFYDGEDTIEVVTTDRDHAFAVADAAVAHWPEAERGEWVEQGVLAPGEHGWPLERWERVRQDNYGFAYAFVERRAVHDGSGA